MTGEINDQTKIGLFTVFGVLPLVTATVFFMATVYYRASAAETRLDKQAEAIKEQRVMLIEIKERTARMEGLITSLVSRK